MYKVYFKTSQNIFRIYDGTQFETCNFLPMSSNVFYMTKSYKATDEELVRYYHDIKIASDELRNSDELRGFNYLQEFEMQDGNMYYRSHTSNIKTIFNLKAQTNHKQHEEIDCVEDEWYEKCHNGGLVFLKPGEHQSYSYDFNMFYPRLLGDKRFSDFQIPTKRGKETVLTELPATLKYGFYRISVTCDNPNFKTIFSLSQENVYTHYSVSFLLELIRKHNFKINIHLIQDGEPNAYLYDDSDIVPSYNIFHYWFSCMYNLKKKYPTNILVKIISSSLWGHLSQKNTICVDSKKIGEYDVDYGNDAEYKIVDIVTKRDGSEYYELLNTMHPYKTNLRLKPFITSYGRNKTARMTASISDWEPTTHSWECELLASSTPGAFTVAPARFRFCGRASLGILRIVRDTGLQR
jgi:hypothetical protein